HACHSRDALNSRHCKIRWLDADEWRSVREYLWPGLPSDGRVQRQHAVEQHTEHQTNEQNAGGYPLDAKRNMTGIWPGQPRRMVAHDLHGDLWARVTRAHKQDAPVLQL